MENKEVYEDYLSTLNVIIYYSRHHGDHFEENFSEHSIDVIKNSDGLILTIRIDMPTTLIDIL